ncbi:hypothetical protein YB2330_002234 [Saitoella coloradoensis]
MPKSKKGLAALLTTHKAEKKYNADQAKKVANNPYAKTAPKKKIERSLIGEKVAVKSTSTDTPSTATDADAKKKSQKPRKQFIPFKKEDTILVVGDGNLSFSASVAEHHLEFATQLTATTHDSLTILTQKYPDAPTHIQTLKDLGAIVLHEVDATKLDKNKTLKGLGKKYDCVVFNFPHVGAGIKDQDRNIAVNQKLLLGFFESAQPILSPIGTVVVSLADSSPYTLWRIRDLAKEQGLRVRQSGDFVGEAFPEYSHRRTIGWQDGVSEKGWKGEERRARIWVFEKDEGERHDAAKKKKKKGVPADSDDEE